MKTTEADIVGKLGDFIDEMMWGIEKEEGILSGDITPMQSWELNDHVDAIAAILYAVLKQNNEN
jgi:hypothetical protein